MADVLDPRAHFRLESRTSRTLLVVGTGLALVDVALDLTMLLRFAAAEQWGFFAVTASVILGGGALTAIYAHSDSSAWWMTAVTAVPGVNILVHAIRSLRAGFKLEALGYARLVEAVVEAMPQSILQATAALSAGARAWTAAQQRVLGASLASSMLSVSWALVAAEMDEEPRARQYVRGWLPGYTVWLAAARLAEVCLRALSLALLGAYRGIGSVLALLALEWLGWSALLARDHRATGAPLRSSTLVGARNSPPLVFARWHALTCDARVVPYRVYAPVRVVSVGVSLALALSSPPLRESRWRDTRARAVLLALAAAAILWACVLPVAMRIAFDLVPAEAEPPLGLCGRARPPGGKGPGSAAGARAPAAEPAAGVQAQRRAGGGKHSAPLPQLSVRDLRPLGAGRPGREGAPRRQLSVSSMGVASSVGSLPLQ